MVLLGLFIAGAALACSLGPALRPATSASGLIFFDDFDDMDNHWYWGYHPGTGTIVVCNGYLFLNVSAASSSEEYSDAEINDIMGGRGLNWLHKGFEVRLRCSDDNTLTGEAGGGTRGWGFWNGNFGHLMGETNPSNVLWFISISRHSEYPFPGFNVMSVRNDNITLTQPVEGVDMRDWHTYGIVWRDGSAQFTVDGRVVAGTDSPPDTEMGLVIWIDNYRIYWDGTRLVRGYVDLVQDEWIQVDYVSIFEVAEDVSLGSAAMCLLGILCARVTCLRDPLSSRPCVA